MSKVSWNSIEYWLRSKNSETKSLPWFHHITKRICKSEWEHINRKCNRQLQGDKCWYNYEAACKCHVSCKVGKLRSINNGFYVTRVSHKPWQLQHNESNEYKKLMIYNFRNIKHKTNVYFQPYLILLDAICYTSCIIFV